MVCVRTRVAHTRDHRYGHWSVRPSPEHVYKQVHGRGAHSAPHPGTDIDDSWAIALALTSPELDIRLIAAATHNTPARARIIAKYLESVGRTDIPIGA
jgi:hypothetical protein